MSDSTLSRRSAALRRLNRPTKLPTGNGEMPENFKYVWLVLIPCHGMVETAMCRLAPAQFGALSFRRD